MFKAKIEHIIILILNLILFSNCKRITDFFDYHESLGSKYVPNNYTNDGWIDRGITLYSDVIIDYFLY